MKISYDPQVDALSITFRETTVTTKHLAEGITADYDSEGRLAGLEILEGQMRLIVDGVPHELSTGDSFYLASNVPHGVETILPTRVLDTFSPPRNDYLAIDEKARHGAL